VEEIDHSGDGDTIEPWQKRGKETLELVSSQTIAMVDVIKALMAHRALAHRIARGSAPHRALAHRIAPSAPHRALAHRLSSSAGALRAERHLCAALRRLGEDASIEIAPRHADALLAHAMKPRTVFVNMVETDAAHFGAVAAAVGKLAAAGREAVPHVPASRLSDEGHAAAVFEMLAGAGARGALVVAGNDAADAAVGVDAAAAAAERAGLRRYFAGFPEGHPWDPAGGLDRLKGRLVGDSAVVAQFVADPSSIEPFLDAVRPRSVHVGVLGPAREGALAAFASRCGVGPSAAVSAAGEGGAAERLVPAVVPATADAAAIAKYLGTNVGPYRRARLHVYPVGGLDPALAWLARLANLSKDGAPAEPDD